MKESTSSVPMLMESSAVENTASEPRRSGRARISTQRFKSAMQPASFAPKTSIKRKRSDPAHDDTSTQLQDTQTTHTQAKAAKNKSKATSRRVANNKPTQSDDTNAKPIAKARPSQHAKNVIDLTQDDEATPSEKPKKSKPGKNEEKRLKA